jgi:hypothetical protein
VEPKVDPKQYSLLRHRAASAWSSRRWQRFHLPERMVRVAVLAAAHYEQIAAIPFSPAAAL